ncbi:MAG: hypothetical protein GWN93_10035 [Deltaproteobacteria bacterium]|nr:hypothetical protein [Deltaproteobacteria bacterium]
MDRSIITGGATLIIATFLIIIVFFVLSNPVTSILDGFDDIDAGDATDDMNTYLPDIRTAFWLGMSIAIVTPAVIFVFWIFHREPDHYYKRRKRF